MARTKKLTPEKTHVTRAELRAELTVLASAFLGSLAEVEARLTRREAVDLYHDVNPMLEAEAASYEGNHLAPSTADGGE